MDINIGKRISNLRTSKGYSVNYLANQAGVSQSFLREIEIGHYENPSIDIPDALCGALGISLKEFFDVHTEIQDSKDLLIDEILQLNPSQREHLRIFLKSVRNGH